MTDLAIRVENYILSRAEGCILSRVEGLSKLHHIGRAQGRHDTLRDAISDFRLRISDSLRSASPQSTIHRPREHPLRVNGATLRVGIRRTETCAEHFDCAQCKLSRSIVAFAETCTERSRRIERFLDTSVKRYSSGTPSARAPGVRSGRAPFGTLRAAPGAGNLSLHYIQGKL